MRGRGLGFKSSASLIRRRSEWDGSTSASHRKVAPCNSGLSSSARVAPHAATVSGGMPEGRPVRVAMMPGTHSVTVIWGMRRASSTASAREKTRPPALDTV
jgi:hypothetical protein